MRVFALVALLPGGSLGLGVAILAVSGLASTAGLGVLLYRRARREPTHRKDSTRRAISSAAASDSSVFCVIQVVIVRCRTSRSTGKPALPCTRRRAAGRAGARR